MTIAQAKSEIMQIYGMLSPDKQRAIDTLVKKEPCEDAISRQKVLDITWEEPSYTDALNVLTEVRDKVKELPSVNPQEPKTGHWTHDGSRWKNRFICSECNNKLYDEPTKYCPNCGCAMKGELE